MHYALIAAVALIGIEAAALACSCMDTDDPAQLRTFAAEASANAVALVEVEALTSYETTPAGEQLRVVRTLAGRAPPQFTVERRGVPSSASCDVLYAQGEKALVILYPATGAAGSQPVYRTSGLCTVHLLDKPVFRDSVADSIRAASGAERG